MPTTTPNYGWSVPVSTDLVKDGATAIELLGDSIDTSLVDLLGGTTGQVLAKASNTDLDFTFVTVDDTNAIQNAIIDAKGDLIGATAADTPARLAVGANGTVLTADSAEATGLKWVAPAGGGKVLQVVSASTTTSTVIASTSYTDSGLSATITPTSATSKILVLTSQVVQIERSANQSNNGVRLLRGATSIGEFGDASSLNSMSIIVGGSTSVAFRNILSINFLDSPATTSATTYKIQGACNTTANSSTITFQNGSLIGNIILMEIGA